MSVAEMQRYIAENVVKIENPEKLEQLVQLIKEDAKPSVTVEMLWAEITTKYGDVMKRLAQ